MGVNEKSGSRCTSASGLCNVTVVLNCDIPGNTRVEGEWM